MTRATTRATTIASRLRQIRDRSHPATRARSAGRVASRIYALATVLYLDDHTFTALANFRASTFPGVPPCRRTPSRTWSVRSANRSTTSAPCQSRKVPSSANNHPQDPDDPTNFNTDCLTCHAMQENDQPTLTRALDHTRANPLHAEAMTTVDELTKTDLVTAVLSCPQCGETSLFNTNWHRELTAFWSFGTVRLTALLENGEHDRWRLLMKGDPSCGFCERLRNNEPDAIVEAVAYTNQNFPHINDDPPIL